MRERSWPWMFWYALVAIASLAVVLWIGVESLGDQSWSVMAGVSMLGGGFAGRMHGSWRRAMAGAMVIDLTIAALLASVPPADALIDPSTFFKTLLFPGAAVGAAAAVAGTCGVWCKHRAIQRCRLRGLCVHCGYDTEGLRTHRCPECGHTTRD